MPNGGHGIAGDERVLAATPAFVSRLDEGRPMPKVELSLVPEARQIPATIRASEPLRSARLWLARGTSPDFRQARFEPLEAAENRGAFIAVAPRAPGESVAYFAEVDFGERDSSFRFSTPIRVDAPASR